MLLRRRLVYYSMYSEIYYKCYRKSEKHITKTFFDKFWKLQNILCNRDYISKENLKWNELRDLLTSVLANVKSIKINGRAQDKEQFNGMVGQKLFVKMQPFEEKGTNMMK